MHDRLIQDTKSPFSLFDTWFKQAEKTESDYPNTMCLSTVDARGYPSSRMVLMKDYSNKGITFYTNFESHKGRDILATGRAALCFHWKTQNRQVRFEGAVVTVDNKEADAYFATRPRGSQIGAWASRQSNELPDRKTFLNRIEKYEKEFEGKDVPRPPHWSGFRVIPETIEFWQEMPYRLHDRLVFKRSGKNWKHTRLYP